MPNVFFLAGMHFLPFAKRIEGMGRGGGGGSIGGMVDWSGGGQPVGGMTLILGKDQPGEGEEWNRVVGDGQPCRRERRSHGEKDQLGDGAYIKQRL